MCPLSLVDSVVHTAHPFARPTHVLLSVHSHLWQDIFLELLVTCRARSSPLRCGQAVRSVRLLGAGAACGLRRTAHVIAGLSVATLYTLHARHLLHLVARSSGCLLYTSDAADE